MKIEFQNIIKRFNFLCVVYWTSELLGYFPAGLAFVRFDYFCKCYNLIKIAIYIMT